MQTIGEVVMGIHELLEDDGVFISETHYLLDVIQGGQFDTIYHEHLRTYSLRSLIAFSLRTTSRSPMSSAATGTVATSACT